ncbi:hypothetical protein EGW08_004043 [Elysia chlorotica]|uniref:Ion transport domain-containing protein n=1 Tax=Elysia chlorotica TaxID=188477 RepID=A0A3S1BP77_ELYCH|nr:hypothetical protein EGW08_004043 [Elysia chlorotica]
MNGACPVDAKGTSTASHPQDEELFNNNRAEKQSKSRQNCFTHSVLLESVVIFLVVISALAITGETLIRFDLIAVPEHESHITSSNSSSTALNDNDGNVTTSPTTASTTRDHDTLQVNVEAMDILNNVFHYTSLGVAGFFCAEIVFKISTLCGEMFSEPWQIFDIVVVFLTLGVELTSHYVDLPWKGLYLIKYIVLLRLWRIPFVCSMKAQQVQQCLEQDMELYRSGQQKAQEKCTQLERSLSQQAEIIRQLEGALQTFTNEREAISYELNPRELLESSKPSPLPRKTIPGSSQLRRSFLRRSKKKEPSGTMETEFSTTDIKTPSKITDTSDTSPDQGFVSDAVDGDDAFVEEGMDTVLDTSQFQLWPKNSTRKAACGKAVASLGAKPSTASRRRTRRSSTSEYLDYAKLTSSASDKDFSYSYNDSKDSNPNSADSKSGQQPNWNSDPNLPHDQSGGGSGKPLPVGPCSHSSSSASDASKPSVGPGTARLLPPDAWSSGGLSEDSSVNGDGGKEDVERSQRNKGKKVRRFSSCPEYAYTQRVTITSEESAFFGDDGSSDEISVHDNLGYVITEAEALHCLAEFDGTKTYRSEEGIPMTSL